jgi:predicted RND superfamily exporter protein
MRKTDKFLESLKGVANSQSAAGLIAEMDDIMEGGKKIPDSRDKIVNLWFLLDGQDIMGRLVSSDLQAGLVQAVSGNSGGDTSKNILDDLDKYVKNMEKEYTGFNRDTADKDSGEYVSKYLVSEAADMIRMDVLKRDHDFKLTAAQLAEVISPDCVKGAINSEKTAGKILSLIPADKQDRFLKQDIADDLKLINDRNVYLPESIYLAMPGKTVENAEKVKFTAEYTGLPLIYNHLDNSLINSQFESFAYALIFIYIIFVMQLKSFRMGLIGLAPIILTVIMMFGIMGFFGIPLDVATVLTGSIALGIGIDYAIHFSVRFKNFYLAGYTAKDAIMETLRTTGKAILINVVAVTMGFLTLLFAQLVPLQRFGILIAVAMVGSGLGALTTLPAMLLRTNPGFLGKLDKKKEK